MEGSGHLPPEVEAEMRRRAEAALPETPPAAWGEPPAWELPPLPPPGQPGSAGSAAGSAPAPRWQQWLKRFGPVGTLLIYLLGKAKVLLVGLKFLKLGYLLTFLKTGGSMLLSIAVYAAGMGWPFAVGLVLTIFVHEMGHVYAAWRLGVPVSAPVFIPGFGAFILQKRSAKSAWDEALIGIGGPVGGTLAGLVCLAIFWLTGHRFFLVLAYVTFLINLFNLTPIFPLDGGWITGAVSPRLWLIGVVMLGAMLLTGFLRNPFILILLVISLPRILRGLRHGDALPPGTAPATPRQRLLMGIAYVALCGLLAWLMAVTHPIHA
jgi:Zn-dependent protease